MEYPFIKERRRIWSEISKYISADVSDINTLLEIGAGYCDFINQFPAKKKICFELNPDRAKFASPDVEFRCGDAIQLVKEIDETVDMVFASNFLEHLSYEQLDVLLPGIYSILNNNGKFVILQPNYLLCQHSYFNDETHRTIFSDENIKPFLEKFRFEILKLIPGLLPFSMKSRLPKWPLLVRLYLNSPFRPYAAQMYIVAQKNRVNYVE